MRAVVASLLFSYFLLSISIGHAALEGIGQEGEWIIFKKSDAPIACGIMAVPTSSELTRDGQQVSANRGNHRLAITMPEGKNGFVSFEAGFPINNQRTIELVIDGRKFTLYTDPSEEIMDYAWPVYTEDRQIISALKAGSSAVITSYSERGTKVVDRFSLVGVTRGIQKAQAACQ